jgi:bacterioferritin
MHAGLHSSQHVESEILPRRNPPTRDSTLSDHALKAEMTARALYAGSATYCHSVADYVSRDLFEELIHDEERHIDFLETQLELINTLGAELYAQRHLGKLE